MASLSPELAKAIIASAGRLGVDPVDIGTAISYETGGTFNPGMWGGAGGRHLGLIQFGAEERAKYGVNEKQSPVEQMAAVESFLRDRGVKPGMGMMDIYSTINAGSPGRYGASDAANGGMPGTVADKVRDQMGSHRAGVVGMLQGPRDPVSPIDPTSTGAPPLSLAAPVGALAQGSPPSTASILADAGSKLTGGGQQQQQPQQPEYLAPQQIQMAQPNVGQSQQIAQAIAKSYGWT